MDNIRVMVQPSQAYIETVRPMLNIGGLVQYVKGAGGVVLCNLKFQETETVPGNAIKKRTILATVLRNLRAPFAGGKTVIAGGEVDYLPRDIHTRATTYKDDRGFFGDPHRSFNNLPAGRNTLAGVVYDIYELSTSPVPQVLMLGGQGVPLNPPREIRDIPVDAQADALFFLHTARMGNRPDDRQRRDQQYPVMFQYVVRYSDGQTVQIQVRSELDIEHYVQQEPQALPGAQLAWAARYENSDDYAAAYALQWNNPRPDVPIRSIDMEYVDESRGVPVLLALTAATAR
jgi:beta-galactosidase